MSFGQVVTLKSLSEIRDNISLDIVDARHWREVRSEEHPDDKRNKSAAEIFERLDDSVVNIPDDVLREYDLLWQCREDGTTLSELWAETLRQVGFSSEPGSATEMVQRFIEEGRRLD